MPITDSQYKYARELLDSGSAPEEAVDGLRHRVAEYDQAHQGEHATLGDNPTLAEAHVRPAGVDKGLIAKVDDAYRAGMPRPGVTQTAPKPNDALKTTSASGHPDLYQPPEFFPPHPVEPPPTSQFDAVWGNIKQAARSMPSSLGGEVEHFEEPTFDQFRMAMAPRYGDIGQAFNFQSGERAAPDLMAAYDRWRDLQWAQARAQAQQQGRPIVRDAFKKPTDISQSVDSALSGAVHKGKDLLLGADKSTTGGLTGALLYAKPKVGSSFVDDLRGGAAARDYELASNPTTSDLGQAAAMFAPSSIASGGARAAEAGAAKLLPAIAEGGVAPGIARGAVGGAGAGVAQSLAQDLASGRTDDLGTNALRSGGEGLGIGAVFGGAGAAAEREGQNLRRTTPLGVAEEGGAKMRANPFSPVDLGPTNRALEERAVATGGGPDWEPGVTRMLAHDLERPVVAEAERRAGDIKSEAGKLRDFEKEHAGDKKPMWATVKAILDAKQKLVQSNGTVASVNQPEMKRLDALLKDVLSVDTVPPEWLQTPKHPGELAQLDAAVDLHGELGTPETYAEDVKNLKQMDTPTRPVKPVSLDALREMSGAPFADLGAQAKPKTAPDLGPFAEGLPSPEGAIRTGIAGERIRSLHEARDANPDTVDLDTKTARGMALHTGLPSGIPDDFSARVAPIPANPGDVYKLTKGLRQRHESSSEAAKEPFPDYPDIKRAQHVDRDQFKGSTADIPSTLEHTLPSGEKLHGYSAKNAQITEQIGKFDNLMQLLGLQPGSLKELRTMADLNEPAAGGQAFQNIAKGYGGDMSPDVVAALRDLAATPEGQPILDAIKRYTAAKQLQKRSAATEIIRLGRGDTTSVRGEAARLRLDPILQGLRPQLQGKAGGLGALQLHGPLPAQADQATLDQIDQILGGP